MNGPEPFDDTDALRHELRALGLRSMPEPEEYGAGLLSPQAIRARAAETPSTKHRRRWPRPALGVLSAAAAALVFAIVPPGNGGRDQQATAPQYVTVAQIVHAAGEAAGHAPEASDEIAYWRVSSVYQQGDDAPATRTIWLGHERDGVLLDGGSRTSLPPATFGLLTRSLTWEQLVGLPAAPGQLQALLDDEFQGARDPDWQVFKTVGEWLAESPAPPRLREALWQVVAEYPRVVAEGSVEDAQGRAGQALTIANSEGAALTYIVDVDDGSMLQSTLTQTAPGKDDFRVTYLGQGPVDDLSE